MNDSPNTHAQDDDSNAQLASSRAPREGQYAARTSPMVSNAWAYDEPETNGFDMRQLLLILKRRRGLILTTFCLITALGAITTWLSKPVYQAQARVMVDTATRTSQGSGEMGIIDAMMGQAGARNLETQIEVFKSPAVVSGARQKLSQGALQSVREYSQVDVQQVGQTDIMEITVKGRNPHAVSAYCNALVDSYMAEDEDTERGALRRTSSFLRDKVRNMKLRRDATARKLRDYKQRNNTVDLSAETTAKITQLGTVVAQRQGAQTERRAASAELAEMRSQAARLTPTQTSGYSVAPSAGTTARKAELATLELELLRARQEFTETSPDVVVLKSRIAQLKRDLSRAAQNEVTGSSVGPNPALTDLRQKIAATQAAIGASEARIKELSQTEQELRGVNRELPAREYEMGSLMTDLATQDQTYQMLNQRYEQLRINENATAASTRLLQSASVPGSPISPRTGRNLLTTLVGALVVAIALAALVDRMDDHVHSEEDAESATRLPIIAHVPFLTGADSASLLDDTTRNSSGLLESYRMLRTNIAFASIDEPIRSLVVTSSQPNEGKSTTSLDLAIVMALDGKKVVILDADLRRPSLNGLLQLSNAVGFTSVVTGATTIEEALQDTSVPNLRAMTSGPIPPNPPELLNSRVGRETILKLAEMVDFLIIDTPPALTMADAQIAASIADATVLVVSARGSNKRDAARTTEHLAQTGTKLLGVVLNKITKEWGASYNYYGGYNVYYGVKPAEGLDSGNGNEDGKGSLQLPKSSRKKNVAKN